MLWVYSLSYRKIAKHLHWMLCILVLVSIVVSLAAAPQPVYAVKSSDVQAFGDKHYESTYSLQNAAPLFAPFSYDNTTSGTLGAQTSCATQLTRTFSVTDSFTVNDLNVGLNVSHRNRGDMLITLSSPAGTIVQLTTQSNDSSNDYDLLFDDSSSNAFNDGNDDNIATPIYGADRIAVPFQSLSAFNNESAQGTWILSLCNVNQGGHSNRTMTFNSAQLVFDGAAVVTIAPNEIRGSVFRDFNSNGIQNTTGVAPDNSIDWGIGNVTVQAFCVTNLGTDGALGTADDTITPSTAVTTTYSSYTKLSSATIGGLYTLTVPTGTITGTLTQPSCRVEFSNFPAGYYPTFYGSSGSTSISSNGTNVQFVNPGTAGIGLGLNEPNSYFPNDTALSLSVFRPGASITQTNQTDFFGYASLPYNATGSANNTGDRNVPDATLDATVGQLGAVWGAGYQRSSGRLYTAAVMKRHFDLGPLVRPATGSGVTSIPVDGIYMLDYAGDIGGSYVGGFKVNGVTPVAGSAGVINTGVVSREVIAAAVTNQIYALSTNANTRSYDVDAFDKAGKIGFGDVEVSEDNNYLWVVNLNQRSLIRIDIRNASSLPVTGTISSALVGHFPIVTSGLPACNGQFRPWALKFANGFGYVGVTCDASSSTATNLRAYVLQFDPNSVGSFTTVATVNLDPAVYKRESSQYNDPLTGVCGLGTQQGWNRWANSWADLGLANPDDENSCPQPILSDIEFADNGDLILSLTDRTGLQLDFYNYGAVTNGATTTYGLDGSGDTIHLCKSGTNYIVEGFSGCVIDNDTYGTTSGLRPLTNDGPNGVGEFYNADHASSVAAGAVHHAENNLGSLALLPGTNAVVATVYDAIREEFTQGIQWYRTRTGDSSAGSLISQYEFPGLIAFGSPPEAAGAIYSKGVSLGDIELLAPPAPIEIGNRVWLDSNGNGIQDPGEAILAGVTVTLTNGSAVTTTTTNTNGEYYFRTIGGNPIQPNTQYTLSLPTNVVSGTQRFALTVSNATGNSSNSPFTDTLDSDINATTGQLSFVTSNAGENNHSFDIGYAPTVSVGNSVWFDTNNNGLFESGEQPTNGVVVQLYRDSNGNGLFDLGVDTLVSNTTTSSSGHYSFTNLAPTVDPSTAYLVVIPNSNFSGVLAGYRNSNGNGTSAPDADINPADNDDNGDEIGTYGTANFVVASKALSLTIAAEPINEIGGNGGNDPTTDTNSNLTVDFGFYKLSVGDLVWEDYNNNGQKDSSEPGLAAVTVQLLDSGNNVISTTTTDANGLYTFTGLVSGTYSIRVTPSSPAYQSSSATVNNDGSNNNDHGSANGGFIVSSLFSLTPGGGVGTNETATAATGSTVNNNLDFGLWRSASLGDYVWEDLNHDGRQNDGNTGLNGVSVALLNSSNQVVSTTTTFTGGTANQPGYYTFTNLISGTYHVSFTLPSGYQWTLTDVGNDALDSDGVANGNSAVTGDYVLNTSQSIATVDQGLWRPSSLGNYVWYDDNRDGLQNEPANRGVNGVTVRIYTSGGTFIGTTATTNDAAGNPGYYTFTNLISDTYYVQFDLATLPTGYAPTVRGTTGTADVNDSDPDATGKTENIVINAGAIDPAWDMGIWKAATLGDYVWEDLNRDGIQTVGEPGVAGVTITLQTVTGTLTTTTDANGLYTFTNLISGTYSLTFTAPSGYQWTPLFSGSTSTANDSNVNPATGATGAISLVTGQSNLTIDGGLFRPATLGDFVWEDLNHDGQQDAGEPGIAGVLVSVQTVTGTLTTTTNASGYYSFTNLVAGTYTVTFSTPTGYQATLANTGSDLSDSDPVSGQVVVNLANGATNLTVDAGFWRPASLGDFVWEELNHDGQQNDGNSGINGVLVTLLNSSNQIVSTTTTFTGGASNQPGYYTFTNLISDTYHLSFTVPAGFQATIANGGSDLSDSDGVQSGNAAVTLGYALGAGQSIATVDQGFSRLATIGDLVWNDLNRNGVFEPGSGETGIANVTINLWLDVDNDGIVNPITDTFVLSQTTNSSGLYQFIGLSAGNYLVDVTDSAGALTDMLLTGGTDPHDVTLNAYQQYNSADFGYAVELKADLSAVKYDLVDPIPAGSTQTYTIVVTNHGPDDAENVIITDALPLGTSYLSDDAGCTLGSGTITCNLGTIANGASVTITVEVIVDSTLGVQSDSTRIGAVATYPPINST